MHSIDLNFFNNSYKDICFIIIKIIYFNSYSLSWMNLMSIWWEMKGGFLFKMLSFQKIQLSCSLKNWIKILKCTINIIILIANNILECLFFKNINFYWQSSKNNHNWSSILNIQYSKILLNIDLSFGSRYVGNDYFDRL